MNRKLVVVSLVMALVLALFMALVPMPVAATGGTVTLNNTSSSQTLSCSDPTCTTGTPTVSGTDTLLTLYVALAGQTASVNVFIKSAVCGGYTLTLLANFTISGTLTFSRIYLFYVVGPAVSGYSCGITTSGASNNVWIYSAQAWSNVAQGNAIAQHAQATGTTQTNYTATVTNTPGSHDLMVDWNLAMAGTINIPSVGAAQTQQWAKTIAAAIYGQGSTKAATAVIPKTMYYTVSVANAAWGQYVVNIGSDFIAATPIPNPPCVGNSCTWTGPGDWTGGSYNSSNLQVVGNCLQLIAGKTDGQWTSAVQNVTFVIVGINITYSGTDASNFVSVVAIQDQNSNNLWKDTSVLWVNGGANLSTGSVLIQAKYQLTFTLHSGNGGTPQVCAIGVQTQPQHTPPPPFDWTPYIIVMVIFVVIALIVVGWKYLA